MVPAIHLKKNEERRIKSGHLWIFSNEIQKIEEVPENGDLVEIYDSKNELLGCGFYNNNSLIAARILAKYKIDDLDELLKKRLADAYQLRKTLYPEKDSFRFVFSESDYLPGLIIDKYNDTFVLQVYSIGMQKHIDRIVKILKNEYSAENIFTKNESYFRKLEGLTEEDEIFLGKVVPEIISDGSIKYKIDFDKGHKTGFYFDQSDNRFFIEKICKGKNVADLFCNSGGFGLHAAKAGASFVTFADSSASEIENVKTNIELNELKCPVNFEVQDIFDFLGQCISENKKFDVVMLDPPAFAKNKKSLPQAKKGYEKLNRLALKTVNEGGFLVTSSCSHHLKKEEFLHTINNAATRAGKRIQLITFLGASKDHPQISSMPETEYLKFLALRVLSP